MDKIIFLIAVLCPLWLFSASAGAAEQNKPPSGGRVILDLRSDTDDGHEITLEEQAEAVMEVGRYFDEKYPGEAINGDLTEDVRRFFPSLKGQEVYDREMLVRDAVKFYRYFNKQYNEIKAALLLPEDPPLVLDEQDYEKPYTGEYIDSPDLVVIKDFKRVVSYSSEPRDFEAYEAKRQRELASQANKSSPIDQLADVFSKLELKKFLFYGIIYEDPLTKGAGNGAWVEKDGAKLRLISTWATVNGQREIRGALHFSLPPGEALALLGKNRPQLSFAGENLAGTEAFMPLPRRVVLGGKEYSGLSGNFALPLVFKLKNPDEPLVVAARAEVSLCTDDGCRRVVFEPELKLESGFGYRSTVDNFITQSFNALPQDKRDEAEIMSLSADKNEDGLPELRLRLKTRVSPQDIDVMIDDDALAFLPPRISVTDDYVDVFLTAADKDAVLLGRTFALLVRLGDYAGIKTRLTAAEAPWLELVEIRLTAAMLLAAFVGGLLLNFMPCVFPVLALKLMSVSGYGSSSPAEVRRSFLYTVLGIFSAFAMLIVLLAALKAAGVALGWGIQFQNGWFLALMLFVLTLFAAQVMGLCTLAAPQWLQRLGIASGSGAFRAWFAGVATVLLSTPCTAPYLATAAGFALTGTNVEMTVVLTVIACGLALPYLLVWAFPSLAVLLPKPGKWMLHVQRFMLWLLLATILWLLSILYAQISGWAVFRQCLYLLSFLFLLAYRRKVAEILAAMRLEKEVKAAVEKLLSRISFILCWLLLLLSLWDVNRQFNRAPLPAQPAAAQIMTGQKIDDTRINALLDSGKSVLVSIDADWCLTCRYNEAVVLDNPLIKELLMRRNVEVITLDWTRDNPEILSFMSRYGRKGVPFYVLFTPRVRGGIVLPELLSPSKLRSVVI